MSSKLREFLNEEIKPLLEDAQTAASKIDLESLSPDDAWAVLDTQYSISRARIKLAAENLTFMES